MLRPAASLVDPGFPREPGVIDAADRATGAPEEHRAALKAFAIGFDARRDRASGLRALDHHHTHAIFPLGPGLLGSGFVGVGFLGVGFVGLVVLGLGFSDLAFRRRLFELGVVVLQENRPVGFAPLVGAVSGGLAQPSHCLIERGRHALRGLAPTGRTSLSWMDESSDVDGASLPQLVRWRILTMWLQPGSPHPVASRRPRPSGATFTSHSFTTLPPTQTKSLPIDAVFAS